MLDPAIIFAGVLNGLLAGGIYVLVAVGLTLIYGVLHIINFAHGSLLMLAMYAVFFLWRLLGIDPYVALPIVIAGSFAFGYVLYRGLIGRLSHGRDENILLITLGLAIVFDNVALLLFTGDSQTIDVAYAGTIVQVGAAFLPLPKIISFLAAIALCGVLGVVMARSQLGKAIRAVARERQGARLVGIDVEHVFAIAYGIGIACLGAAACLLMPTFYVSPTSGHAFVLIAFTTVVLGGMGSFVGAAAGGLIIGITESLGGLLLGEQLGQIGISLIFILILLLRPTGLFGVGR
ncbi:branched-chain amino acid ABC transporter permease [Reyranella sp. CPCC 100927]|uniref:branched-chain amino acid ABC transporter permease n=1 Tax=Reyranella sp. CPCC 100927 TaxID=2599616 RepID=UPI0011B75A08|nr:branched-chain amino acid ABC transporter permease [Reyranella sp. CPCC 100927]TWT11444.1 branched-chain amino acid ABC transporter permease [Reyranella sp. CPCC 100927]